MAIQPATGARVYFGWGLSNQAAPEVPVAITDYIPVEPDGLTIDADMGRKPLEVAGGTLIVERYLTESDAKVAGAVAYPIFGSLGQSLVLASGFDAGGLVTAPQFITAEIYRAGQSFLHAGLLPKMVKWEMGGKKATKITVDFDGIARPTLTTPSIDPATFVFPADQPYVWGHMQPILTIGGGAVASKYVDEVTIELKFDNQAFHGANGSAFPTLIVPGPVSLSGSFKMLFTSTADWDSYMTVGQTPGPLQFQLVRGSNSVTWTLPSCMYSQHKFSNPIKAPIIEDISWHAMPSAQPLLHYAVV